jgi:hypothetical protein
MDNAHLKCVINNWNFYNIFIFFDPKWAQSIIKEALAYWVEDPATTTIAAE